MTTKVESLTLSDGTTVIDKTGIQTSTGLNALLPTTDPLIRGRFWNSDGTLKISDGPGVANIPGIVGVWLPAGLAADGDAISSWVDAVNGRSLAQATGANQPVVRNGFIRGKAVKWAQFDGTQSSAGDRLTWVSALSQPTHVFVVHRLRTSLGATNHVVIDGAYGFSGALFRDVGGAGKWSIKAGTQIPASPSANLPATPKNTQDFEWKVGEAFFSGASSYMKFNGVLVASGNAGTTATDGITLGGNDQNYCAVCDIAMVIVCSQEQTGQNLAEIYDYIQLKTGLWCRQSPINPALNIVCHGDSITYGVDSGIGSDLTVFDYYRDKAETTGASYPSQLGRRLYNFWHRDVNWTNLGVSGQSLSGAGATSSMIDTGISSADPLLDNVNYPKRNILIAWAGVNDDLAGRTVTQKKIDLDTYLDARIAAGWRSNGNKLLFITELPHETYSEPNRAEFNNYIRAKVGVKIDAVVDMDREIIGVAGAQNDTALYDAQKLHPLQIGHTLIANRVYNALLPLL